MGRAQKGEEAHVERWWKTGSERRGELEQREEIVGGAQT